MKRFGEDGVFLCKSMSSIVGCCTVTIRGKNKDKKGGDVKVVERCYITQNWISWSTIHLKLSSKKVCVFGWSASSVGKPPGEVVGSTWKPCMPALMRASTACAAPGLELPCPPRRQLTSNHHKFLVQLQLPRYYNCKFWHIS